MRKQRTVDELHLTDEQYVRILKKMRRLLVDGFVVWRADSTFVGDKWTKSNAGFCNDELTDKDSAMWPENWPERKDMKYLQDKHKCPYDMRKEPGLLGWGSGCFSECYLFSLRNGHDLQLMRKLVDDLIAEVK